MADAIAVIVRFDGNPDDLFERFERARRLWIGSQPDDYARPIFYAACKTNDGIVIVNGWQTEADHNAFGRHMGPHLLAVGLERPRMHEHLRIEKPAWD
jgi:hypothetical protein